MKNTFVCLKLNEMCVQKDKIEETRKALKQEKERKA